MSHKKIEYKVISQGQVMSSSIAELTFELNYLGTEGWELCGSDYGCLIFKREKREPPAPFL